MSLWLLLGGALFLYVLFYRPEIIAVLLFTLIIANINFDLKGLPLNLKAVITILLFGRIIAIRTGDKPYPSFLSNAAVKCLLVYMAYVLVISTMFDLFSMDLLKQAFSTCIASFCVYHYFFHSYNDNYLKIALILSGSICFADLAYTYIHFGSFPVRRIYLQYIDAPAEMAASDDETGGFINWNFFGQICGMCFIFLFNDFIKDRLLHKLMILLLPVMFLGVLMSTSRSTLLGIIVMSIVLILNAIKYKDQKNRVYKIGALCIGTIFIGILLFSLLGKYINLDSSFVDQIVARLTEEPVALIRKTFGYSYNVNNMGPMAWREEASSNAYGEFLRLNFTEQLFGIGNGGFIQRNLGNGLNPHNGLLLILIEDGIVGFASICP